jgi:hypothetical protein
MESYGRGTVENIISFLCNEQNKKSKSKKSEKDKKMVK